MARVTVEDCTKIIPDRFALVAIASRRARDISSGAPITVERHADKDAVIALREIAVKTISATAIKEEIINSYQRNDFKIPTNREVSQKTKESLKELTGMSVDDMHTTSLSNEASQNGIFSEDNVNVDD